MLLLAKNKLYIMKIGIITHYLHFGYGGVMQNYALQTVLKRLGHNPMTFRVDAVKNRGLLWCLRSWIVRILHSLRGIDSGITRKQDLYISKEVEKFISSHISCTNFVRTNNDFRKVTELEKFDALIVGSDQIWRNNYDYVSNCFLDFAKGLDVKRIAYAASFGIDKWCFTMNDTQKYKALVKDFDKISVREDSGIELCSKYLDRDDVELVLDPTLLLDKNDYIALINEANEPHSDGKLFTYVLDKTPQKAAIIKEVSRKLGLKRFECMPQYDSTYDNVKKYKQQCIYPPITKWLRSFLDAEFVVTDSFHGTVFSIIFNKPFFVILNKERGNARFKSVLTLFNLDNRIVNNDIELDYNNIDWDYVNKKRKMLVEKSISYIRGALS